MTSAPERAMRGRAWIWWLLIALILFLVAFWPISTQNAPLWSVCVVDRSNHPVADALVRERYQDYSVESQGHEMVKYTGPDGCVVFPGKTVEASPFMRLLLNSALKLNPSPPGFGPNASVSAWSGPRKADDIREGFPYVWNGSPDRVTSVLVLPDR